MDTRILIVEDEVEIREGYKRLMREKYHSLRLAGETDDVQEALRIVQTIPVDVILLDLELGGSNGIIFLGELRKLQIEKPLILAVTKVNSKKIHDAIRGLGVDSFFVKDGTELALEKPLATLEIVYSELETMKKGGAHADELNAQNESEPYKKDIRDVLKEMGFPSKKQGTNQCVDAIHFIALSGDEEISVTKQVYPYVAGIYNTNSSNVEVNIRKSIERVWLREYERKLWKWYPYEWSQVTGRPTNAEFLINMAKRWMR